MKKWLKDITGITAEEEKVQAEKDTMNNTIYKQYFI